MIYIIPGENPLFHFLFKDTEKIDTLILDSLFNKELSHSWQLRIRKRLGNYFEYICIRLFQKLNKEITDTGVLLFSNISIVYVNYLYLLYLQKKGFKIVLYFLDSVLNNDNAFEALNYTKKVKFDVVYSYDKGDVLRYGYQYYPTIYPSLSQKIVDIKYDFCFIGSEKGRVKQVLKIKKNFNNLESYISMIQISDEMKDSEGFQSNKPLTYDEVLDRCRESNVIVDIVAGEGQSGLSLRPYEAIVLNKKLLTNNPSILSFPYYNPDYMLYFENVEEIPCSFLTERVKVDYNYKGDFSPENFLKRIIHDIR